MSESILQTPLNDCGCCEGQTASTPQRIENRTGLPTISYRVGDYHRFKDSMLARLSSSELTELHGLSTRDDSDFSIALIDAWATVSEVLCFYQEYFANEGLLRTAKERLSVLEHARLIGYSLHPGVSASSYVAFTMDEAPAGTNNPVLVTTIGAGVKIQSTPGPEEIAQLYETESEIIARVDWNAIRPRMTQPQVISNNMQSVVIDGITSFVKPGDNLLLIDGNEDKHIKKVSSVITDDVTKTTQLRLLGNEVSPATYSITPKDDFGYFSLFDEISALDGTVINFFIDYSWSIEDIISIAETKHWDIDEIDQRLNTHANAVKKIQQGVAVYGFHKRANLFGYNATSKVTYSETYPYHPNDIASWGEWTSVEANNILFLDIAYTEIVPDSYIILSASSKTVYQINDVKTLSRTAYGISGKSSKLFLKSGNTWAANISTIREAEVLVQSESLVLSQVPVDEKISGDRLLLERADLYLRNQQYITVCGERNDQQGVMVSEVLQIKEARLEHGFTQLIFATSLKHTYKRDTVTINANVALVSHGESVSEILGSGDASLQSQSFSLKQAPLTYISADTTSGVSSTLEIRINNVLWHEEETFLGKHSDEKIYTTKRNDDGVTTVSFGDGIEGARLPSGNNNIIANYRKGSGLGGLIKSKQLNLLLTRPLCVKDAINPVASSGADDPEKLDDARINAPLGLLTLDRAVSLQDYENYSRSFAGVRKARAIAKSRHGVPRIYITLAGPDGALIDASTTTYEKLLKSLKNSGDPYAQFLLLSYRPAYFKLDAELYVHPDYISELVLKAAQLALREQFSFDARSFNQPVHLSEVISTLQQVDGVTAVDVNYLYRSDAGPVTPPPRTLMPNISSSQAQISGAELLTLDPAPLDQIRVKA